MSFEYGNGFYGINSKWMLQISVGVGIMLAFIILARASAVFQIGMPMALRDAFSILGNVVLAPVIEEVVFRMIVPFILLRLLIASNIRFLANGWVVLILQAGIFSLAHFLAYGISQEAAFGGAFVFGLVSGLAYTMTQSILPSIIAHAGLNMNTYLDNTNVLAVA